MDLEQFQLAGLWVGIVLLYLYVDMLRVFSYDFPEVMDTRHISKRMWLGAAVIMSLPIVMIPFTLLMPYAINVGQISLLRVSSLCSSWATCAVTHLPMTVTCLC